MPYKFESNNENFTKGGDANADLARNFSPNDRVITGIQQYGEAGTKSDYIDKLGFPSSSSLLPTEDGGRNDYTMRGTSDTSSGGSYNQGGGYSYNQGDGGSANNQAPEVDPSSSSYSGGLDSSRGGGTKAPQNLWDAFTDFFGLTPND